MGTKDQLHTNMDNRTNVGSKSIHHEKNEFRMVLIKIYRFFFDVLLFYLAWIWFRYRCLFGMPAEGFRYNYYVTIVYAVLLYWFKNTFHADTFGYYRIRTIALAQFLSQVTVCMAVYFGVSIAWQKLKNPWVFVVLLSAQALIDIAWAYFGSIYYQRIYPKKRTLLIYRNDLDKKRFGATRGKPMERLYEIVDELKYDGSFHELEPKLKDYDAFFVAGVNSRCRNGILKYSKRNEIPCFVLPHIGDAIMQEAIHIQSFDSPVLYVNRTYVDPLYALVKRTFDIVVSGLALIILSPLMLITSLVIVLYDRGPAWYKQVRLTKDGKEFKIIKFRSMRVDAEKDGVARLSSGENDDRITPVGRVIRKLRIDELPQLINIFRGEMSVVGPRPERPEIAEQYYEKMPDFKLRLQVKAGLTGYAQIYGRYNSDPYEKLEFDLFYINQMSLTTDFQLCFATLLTFFSKDNTKGIEEGQTTALSDAKNEPIIDYEEVNGGDSPEADE